MPPALLDEPPIAAVVLNQARPQFGVYRQLGVALSPKSIIRVTQSHLTLALLGVKHNKWDTEALQPVYVDGGGAEG